VHAIILQLVSERTWGSWACEDSNWSCILEPRKLNKIRGTGVGKRIPARTGDSGMLGDISQCLR